MKQSSKIFPILFTAVAFLAGCAAPPAPRTSEQRVTVKGYNPAGGDESNLRADYELVSRLQDDESVAIIFDASGSMTWPLSQGGAPRYKQAHKALSEFIGARGKSGNMALFVYGSRLQSGIYNGTVNNLQRARRSCLEDVELRVPLSPFDPANFKSELDRLEKADSYRGDTPIGGSIAAAAEYLMKTATTSRKSIIVVTDGEEECWRSDGKGVIGSKSPEEAVREANDKGIEIRFVPFGIGIDKDGKRTANAKEVLERVKGLAVSGLYEANTGEELLAAMMKAEINRTQLVLRDGNSKDVATFRVGETFNVPRSLAQTGQSKSEFDVLVAKAKQATGIAPEQPKSVDPNAGKTRYELVSRGGQPLKVSIGIPAEKDDIRIHLGFRSKSENAVDIYPEDLRWR